MALFEDVPDKDLTFRHLIQLEESDDPADVDRAARMSEPYRKAMQKGVTLATADLGFAKLRAFPGLGDQWRKQQDDLERSMRQVAEITAARQKHQADAHEATIESAHLLDSLVSLADAQSAQLALMSTLLQGLATEAEQSSADEASRWKRTWKVMVWTLVASAVAAIGGVGAVIVTSLN